MERGREREINSCTHTHKKKKTRFGVRLVGCLFVCKSQSRRREKVCRFKELGLIDAHAPTHTHTHKHPGQSFQYIYNDNNNNNIYYYKNAFAIE